VIENVIQLGEPRKHRGIVVTPLFPLRDPVAAYVTLDEALGRGLRVTEVSESGSVPELTVENPLDARVLLYDGEELVGAKQDRILNVTVLVEAGAKLPIPVANIARSSSLITLRRQTVAGSSPLFVPRTPRCRSSGRANPVTLIGRNRPVRPAFSIRTLG
jgi:hypothetical protein